MTAAELYREMHSYLVERGWQREEAGSGWWIHDDFIGDLRTGDACQEQMESEGVDTRVNPISLLAGLRSLTPVDFGHSVRVDAEQLARTEFGGES